MDGVPSLERLRGWVWGYAHMCLFSCLGHDGVAAPDVALGALAVEPSRHELPLHHDGLEDAVRQHRAVPQHGAVDLRFCIYVASRRGRQRCDTAHTEEGQLKK